MGGVQDQSYLHVRGLASSAVGRGWILNGNAKANAMEMFWCLRRDADVQSGWLFVIDCCRYALLVQHVRALWLPLVWRDAMLICGGNY